MEAVNIHDFLTGADFAVVALYLLVIVGIGYYYSFVVRPDKAVDDDEDSDLFLAGRSLRWPSIGLTMWGTNVGPSMLIASCGVGYTTGIVAGNFSWYAFPFILLLAVVFAPFYKSTRVTTLPEFMGRRFDATTRELLAWYTMVTILLSWLGLTLYAGGLLLAQIMDWDLWLAVVALVLLASFFAISGGLEAIAKTNVFQMMLLIVVSAVLVGAGLYRLGDTGLLATGVPGSYWDLLLPLDNPDYPWLAILLGYPVLGIWFWCTDQSMVQSVLGAKTLEQGQLGTNFTAWLKILDVPLFILPGILCFLLFPGLEDENEAYMTMVTQLLPVGMVGLVIAVLIAALVSTIDAALNSLSTVFTFDIYRKRFAPAASARQTKRVGRIVMAAGAVLSVFIALAFESVKDLDLFSLFQAILGYLAPPMSAVFLIGVLWKGMTARAANTGLIVGSLASLVVGYLQLSGQPAGFVWPHFLYVSFFLFVGIVALVVVVSLLAPERGRVALSLPAAYRELDYSPARGVVLAWAALVLTMVVLYVVFG